MGGDLQQADALYVQALDSDASDAMLHWFIAQYARFFRGNNHVESLYMMTATVRATLTVAHTIGIVMHANDCGSVQRLYRVNARVLTFSLRCLSGASSWT